MGLTDHLPPPPRLRTIATNCHETPKSTCTQAWLHGLWSLGVGMRARSLSKSTHMPEPRD